MHLSVIVLFIIFVNLYLQVIEQMERKSSTLNHSYEIFLSKSIYTPIVYNMLYNILYKFNILTF